MTNEEISKIKEHIEIHARREPYAIKITEIMWKAVKEILQTVLDKWKEERWILQTAEVSRSEDEVREIENLMEQAENFLKE